MSTQPSDPEVEKLLAELRSDDAERRKAAAEEIAMRKLRNGEIIRALKVNAFNDTNEYARQAAEQALVSLGLIVPRKSSARSRAATVAPLSRQAKIVQFTSGFLGWFLINGIAWLVLTGGQRAATNGGVSLTPALLLFPINLIALIVLAFKRRWVALGMLSAMALNLLIALILGLSFAAFCFVPFFTPGLH